MQAAVPGCFVKRRWGRGPQKSPPETFVRGLAVPPCSTPVTMPKKDPKKLCAFWGLISVPVVGVEPTRCHHQRILSRFQQKACKCSFAFFSPFSFLNCAVKIANGQTKGEASDHAVRKKSADIFDIKSKCASGHASKCGRIVCAPIRIKE